MAIKTGLYLFSQIVRPSFMGGWTGHSWKGRFMCQDRHVLYVSVYIQHCDMTRMIDPHSDNTTHPCKYTCTCVELAFTATGMAFISGIFVYVWKYYCIHGWLVKPTILSVIDQYQTVLRKASSSCSNNYSIASSVVSCNIYKYFHVILTEYVMCLIQCLSHRQCGTNPCTTNYNIYSLPQASPLKHYFLVNCSRLV